MIMVVFRSRLRPGAQAEYGPMAARMSELARSMPGYLSHKGFVAEDGERLTFVEFEDEKAMQGWAAHLEHVQAKKAGRQKFFSEYRVQIGTVVRDSRFPREGADSKPAMPREG